MEVFFFKDSGCHKIVEYNGCYKLQELSLAMVAYVNKLETERITL
jgi:hypothetical protein